MNSYVLFINVTAVYSDQTVVGRPIFRCCARHAICILNCCEPVSLLENNQPLELPVMYAHNSLVPHLLVCEPFRPDCWIDASLLCIAFKTQGCELFGIMMCVCHRLDSLVHQLTV